MRQPWCAFALFFLAGACGGELPGATDAGARDASDPPGPSDAGPRPLDAFVPPGVDGGPPPMVDAGPPPAPGVEVSHTREVRGVWIATVFNINWPSRAGLTAAQQQQELVSLFDTVKGAGFNTVFLQVRAEADAFYRSDLEPFSRFLTGTQGQDPGYDPLEFAVAEAHARGLELHAWVNPYRALGSASRALAAPSHLVHARRELTIPYSNVHWISPHHPEARAHTLAVIRDILTRYDVDGLHFDDYFYPYPEAGHTFDDADGYAAHQGSGGTLSLGDWRRENVNSMVGAVHDLVREVRPDIRFGIAPFGIYRPGMPEGIRGLDAYDAIYCDSLRWIRERWIDYIAPQLYWPTTRTAQAYGRLVDWWADQASASGVDLLAGNFLEKLGSADEWPLEEFRLQVEIVRAARDRRGAGNIQYHIRPLVQNRQGVRDQFANLYAVPAASPPLPGVEGRPDAPTYSVAEAAVTPSTHEGLRYFAAYTQDGALAHLAPAGPTFTLPRGEYLVSAIDRQSRESLARPVSIDVDGPPPPPPPTGRSCTHSFGGVYVDKGCSPSFQCCDGAWSPRGDCGACACEEATGEVGCGVN